MSLKPTVILLLVLFLASFSLARDGQASNALNVAQYEGLLSVAWGDPRSPSQATQRVAILRTDDNIAYELNISESSFPFSQFRALSGKRVRLTVQDSFNQKLSYDGVSPSLNVLAIQQIDTSTDASKRALSSSQFSASQALTGSRNYVSILCKFSDVNAEPRPISYFNGMYGDSSGQLGHYWREVSSNRINLQGSRAYGGNGGNSGWFTLPRTRNSYLVVGDSRPNFDLLFNDCTSQADAFIDFNNVDGINLMFNADLGCCAWGGTFTAQLDGQNRTFPTTWNPDWAFEDVAVIAHEMGHSFGLPHSNNSDGDNDPYDSPWSVMSFAFGGFTDPTYGLKGVHLNAYEKNTLGWIAANEAYSISKTGVSRRIELSFISRSRATSGAYRMATLRLANGRYFTLEARQRGGTYEGLVGTAVLIHEVNENREEPSWLVDQRTPASDFANTPGVMWLPGETYSNEAAGLRVTVVAQTPTGFLVDVLASGGVVPVGAIQLLLDES